MAETAEKIARHHLERRAYVYVRQSSMKQVQQNREGRENQYALVERAVALGWARERVNVIDTDLGQSGQDSGRPGFRELVTAVSLGQVGLVLAYEASRLARNNGDWYALLDLATVRGTLIADSDGVYDPRSYNDRLLLGLRGMLSEAELHLLRLRLDAGRMRQVERGEYRQRLPTGLVRLPDGRVALDPDQQVRGAIALVFETFRRLGSAQKVLRRLRDDGVLLPRAQSGGLHAGQLLWRKPSDAAILEILGNPAYAGAFVYGRTGAHPDRRPGEPSRVKRRRPEDWAVVHRDAYPAYISWEEYLANQARLADNASRYDLRARGAPREGSALLVGLVACGRCGHQMRITYKSSPRYFCHAMSQHYGAPSCLNVHAPSVDASVVAAFFEALAPAELALLEEALAAERAEHGRVAQHHADRIARAEYEARLAQRQYQAVDPDNRLVAAELERRWELALRAIAEAREAAQRFAQASPPSALDPALRAQLADLGQQLPALWESGRLTAAHRKELLRSLIRRVIVDRPTRDTLGLKVVWVSGAISELTAHPPIHRAEDVAGYDRFVSRVLELSAEGHQDVPIAEKLTAEGFRSARGLGISKALVLKTRRRYGQASLTEQFRSQSKIGGEWTVLGFARLLGVDRNWLYRRLERGELIVRRHPITQHYLIPDDPALVARLRAQLPRESDF